MQNEDGSYKDLPTFHNIVCWSKLAERMAKVLTKGKKVYIEGRIENRSYEVEGVKKYTSEVVGDNIIVFERGARAGGEGGGGYEASAPAASKPKAKKKEVEPTEPEESEQVDPEDIPF